MTNELCDKSECDICMNLISESQAFIGLEKFVDSITIHAESLCEIFDLGVVTEECKNVAQNYVPVLINELQILLNPTEVCYRITQCDPSDKGQGENFFPSHKYEEAELNSISHIPDFDPICLACETTIDAIKTLINLADSGKQIEDLLLFLCSHFTTISDDDCKTYIKFYFHMILDIIRAVPAKNACMMMKVCDHTNRKLSRFDSVIDINDLEPLHDTELSSFLLSDDLILQNNQMTQSYDDVGNGLCIICELIAKHLQSLMKDDHDEIKSTLRRICETLPALDTYCDMIIDDYFEHILRFVEDSNAAIVCQIIFESVSKEHLRTFSVQYANEMKDFSLDENDIDVGSGWNFICPICQYAMKLVNKVIKGSLKTLEKSVEELCKLLPKMVRGMCKKASKRLEKLISGLIDKLKLVKICKIIHVCPGYGELSWDMQEVFQELKEIVDDGDNEQVLKAIASKSLRKILPTKLSKLLVDTYFHKAMALIKSLGVKRNGTTEIEIIENTDCALCHKMSARMIAIVDFPFGNADIRNLQQKTCEDFAEIDEKKVKKEQKMSI